MIPADDIPGPTGDQLDRINTELQDEAEERRLRGGDDEPAGVIRFGPPKLLALPDEDTGRRFLTVYDDSEADLDRRECKQMYLPDEPPC